MKIIKVRLKKNSYNIIVGFKILQNLGSHILRLDIGKDAFIITNQTIRNKYGTKIKEALSKKGFTCYFQSVADSEKSKSLNTASRVIENLARFDRKRQVFILGLGGGVIGDLCGFVASVYRRGIPYIQVPTTLLAQIDSSIGEKTAVDLSSAKNLAGTFYQPKLVFSDIALLRTLNRRQIISGLSEVIKCAIIKDAILLGYLEKNMKGILALNKNNLEFIVSRCAKIKADIVSSDEKEKKGLRTILNFGHTIGHAIEAASGYRRYNHGEAVALGMLCAAQISFDTGILQKRDLDRLKRIICLAGLASEIKGLSLESIISAHYHDKKFWGVLNKFVLLRGLGKPKIVTGISLKVIERAIEKFLG